jgi:hypothetical protein
VPRRLKVADHQPPLSQAVHARQPGYKGSIVVDAGNGRCLTINLWETEEHAAAVLPAMVPEVQRLLEPMMAGPSQLIATGPVVLADLTQD